MEAPIHTYDSGVYAALRDGPASAAEIRKRTKMSEEDFDEVLAEWQSRLWIEQDDSGKTPKFSLTDQGRRDMTARYDN